MLRKYSHRRSAIWMSSTKRKMKSLPSTYSASLFCFYSSAGADSKRILEMCAYCPLATMIVDWPRLDVADHFEAARAGSGVSARTHIQVRTTPFATVFPQSLSHMSVYVEIVYADDVRLVVNWCSFVIDSVCRLVLCCLWWCSLHRLIHVMRCIFFRWWTTLWWMLLLLLLSVATARSFFLPAQSHLLSVRSDRIR